MTSQELAESLIKYAKAISPEASVIVYVDVNDNEDRDSAVSSSSSVDHWDVTSAVTNLVDTLAYEIEDMEEAAT